MLGWQSRTPNGLTDYGVLFSCYYIGVHGRIDGGRELNIVDGRVRSISLLLPFVRFTIIRQRVMDFVSNVARNACTTSATNWGCRLRAVSWHRSRKQDDRRPDVHSQTNAVNFVMLLFLTRTRNTRVTCMLRRGLALKQMISTNKITKQRV